MQRERVVRSQFQMLPIAGLRLGGIFSMKAAAEWNRDEGVDSRERGRVCSQKKLEILSGHRTEEAGSSIVHEAQISHVSLSSHSCSSISFRGSVPSRELTTLRRSVSIRLYSNKSPFHTLSKSSMPQCSIRQTDYPESVVSLRRDRCVHYRCLFVPRQRHSGPSLLIIGLPYLTGCLHYALPTISRSLYLAC